MISKGLHRISKITRFDEVNEFVIGLVMVMLDGINGNESAGFAVFLGVIEYVVLDVDDSTFDTKLPSFVNLLVV